ncbi:hypothetical protein, partial [Nocardia brasiliensis]|uniref:hypothetical protein n=1 Tax=Nocardia brasiliensis TaxID=37326 RepID=UPI00245531CF
IAGLGLIGVFGYILFFFVGLSLAPGARNPSSCTSRECRPAPAAVAPRAGGAPALSRSTLGRVHTLSLSSPAAATATEFDAPTVMPSATRCVIREPRSKTLWSGLAAV